MIWLGKIPYELALWFFQIPMTILLLYGNKFSCLFWSFLLHWIQSAVLLFCHCSVTQSCPTLSDPMDCSRPGFCVFYHLLDVVQTHVHLVGDAIQPSQPLLSPSTPALNLSQNQGLFQWVSSLHQVAKVLEFQLQHPSFQWTPRTGLL